MVNIYFIERVELSLNLSQFVQTSEMKNSDTWLKQRVNLGSVPHSLEAYPLFNIKEGVLLFAIPSLPHLSKCIRVAKYNDLTWALTWTS